MCIRKSYIETEDKVFFGYRGKQKRDQVLCIAFFFYLSQRCYVCLPGQRLPLFFFHKTK